MKLFPCCIYTEEERIGYLPEKPKVYLKQDGTVTKPAPND